MHMGTYTKVYVSQNSSCVFSHYVEYFDMWIAFEGTSAKSECMY